MKRILAAAAVAVAVAATFGGCATQAVDTFRAEGMQRASFELKCPTDKLELRELSPGYTVSGNLTGQVAVSGCGQQTVYYKNAVNSWIRNSEIQKQ